MSKVFLTAVGEYHGEENEEAFRGDDGIAFFEKDLDCVNAGISFLEKIPEIIRKFAVKTNNVKIQPRIIAFNDSISGEKGNVYTGTNYRGDYTQREGLWKSKYLSYCWT
ncbi:MAG: hypothetical protein HW406_316 [Candidatus Brocadiaceae bacterium]|nr:hypothetical protein [Candidatus Brocadiaceae bacterium]